MITLTIVHQTLHDHETNLYQLDKELYVIRMIVSSFGIITGVSNIIMHLMFKELHKVFEILNVPLSVIAMY